MPSLIVRALISVLALFMLYWTGIRLDCLFYGAFEYAQAEVIRSALPRPARIIGAQHWMYTHFYTGFHTSLLALYYISAVYLAAQFFIDGMALYVFTALYAVSALTLICVFQFSRVPGRDGRPHIPYNTFAPLHEKQRRELNTQRNQMRISGLLQRMDLFKNTPPTEVSDEKRQRTAEHFIRY